MEIKIDKGVPIIGMGWSRSKKYPFAEMEIGDSFFLAGADNQKFSSTFSQHRPKRFSVRTVIENEVKGLRVWRVA